MRAYRIIGEGEVATLTPPQEGLSSDPSQIIFASDLFGQVLKQAQAVAATNATVLIEGESGVGKEPIARRIHEQSPRHKGPFVKVDCASIPPERFESEFFGQAASSLPGTSHDQAGRLERLRDNPKAQTLARQHTSSFALDFVRSKTAVLHQYRRELSLTKACVESGEALRSIQGGLQLQRMDTLLKGWVLMMQGQDEQVINLIGTWLHGTESRLELPYILLLLLAESYGKLN